jgi:hypothetical protein
MEGPEVQEAKESNGKIVIPVISDVVLIEK